MITYGIEGNTIDITEICFNSLLDGGVITIQSSDHSRAHIFTDPLPGVLKSIFITDTNNVTTKYDDKEEIEINISNNTITSRNIFKRLSDIHSKLQIMYGSLNEEFPEQMMAARYLTGNEKVLEIGGNIGRNSLVIASILGANSRNFVAMECDAEISEQLRMNRDLNNLDFHIETSALSLKKLIQRGWDTIPSDILLDGYKDVAIISYKELVNKYNIAFDTLVLDCEGAFYYILNDMPEILTNVNLIIMENDYHNIAHKQYIDDILLKNNFYIDYVESGGWGPCYSNFFEVWKR